MGGRSGFWFLIVVGRCEWVLVSNTSDMICRIYICILLLLPLYLHLIGLIIYLILTSCDYCCLVVLCRLLLLSFCTLMLYGVYLHILEYGETQF